MVVVGGDTEELEEGPVLLVARLLAAVLVVEPPVGTALEAGGACELALVAGLKEEELPSLVVCDGSGEF